MLLINPAAEKFGGYLARYVPVGIPVSIGCLAAYMEKQDIECRVLDEEIVDITPQVLRERLTGLPEPYLIGITCLTAHATRAYEVAAMAKSEFPSCKIVIGGLHPTALPDEALETGFIDYVVRGEGEEVLHQLYKAHFGNGVTTEIRGISYFKNGEIVHNPDAPLIPDLNTIPMFPYHLFNHPKYDMGFLITSRGCPYRCSYCSQRLLTGMTYRYKSAEQICDELEILADQYGQNAVMFYDDNFCLKAKRVLDLCDLIIDRGLHKKVELSVQTRADNFVFHGGDKVAGRMVEAGFKQIGFGLETGVQRLADLVMKDETVQIHLDATALARKHGMDVSLFMIFGLPTETADDRKTSYDVVSSQNVLATKFNNLIPYPGTPLFNDLVKSGRVKIAPNWSNFNSTLAITNSIFDTTPLPYVPETTSEWELKREIIRYNFRSYVSLKSIAGILGHTKGMGWFRLPDRWYASPREIYEISKVGIKVLINMGWSYLPLWLTQPIMHTIFPALKDRVKVEGYSIESHEASDWDEHEAKRKTILLKGARDEYKEKGEFSVLVSKAAG